MANKAYYPALIHKDEDSDYGISFPDFPGCVSAGNSVAEAVAMGTEALNLHIAGMASDGETIPEPTAPEKVALGDAVALLLVEATRPGKSVRINVTMDENLLEQIDAVSKNRSGFLAQAAREKLSRGKAA